MSTLDKIPLRPPDRWSAEWFARWVYETLAPAIADGGGGGGGGDVTDLIAASLVTAEPEAALPNTRTLIGQPGVLSTVDHGPGVSLEIRIEDYGVRLGQIQKIPGPSLLGTPIVAPETHVQALTGEEALEIVAPGGIYPPQLSYAGI
jgi:hypothetical protein